MQDATKYPCPNPDAGLDKLCSLNLGSWNANRNNHYERDLIENISDFYSHYCICWWPHTAGARASANMIMTKIADKSFHLEGKDQFILHIDNIDIFSRNIPLANPVGHFYRRFNFCRTSKINHNLKQVLNDRFFQHLYLSYIILPHDTIHGALYALIKLLGEWLFKRRRWRHLCNT